MSQPAIICEGLSKRYSGVVALDNLNLSVDECSVFGFLGPNGAGKTTTVRLLVGLSSPTSGKAIVAGQPVSAESLTLRSAIGYLPEVPAFYDWMTGAEFMRYVARLQHLPAGEIGQRCDELLALVALEKAAARRIGGYSRGMKQRLGIAQALVNRPRVLFLDEPCSALDPVGRRDVLALIQRLSHDSTIFMSTHILADVERVCDHLAIIKAGRMVVTSSVEALRQKYSRSVFELEFEEDTAPLEAALSGQPWLVSLEKTASPGSFGLRLKVSNVEQARSALLALVAASGLTLLRYEAASPSLEDIFIQLVESGGAA